MAGGGLAILQRNRTVHSKTAPSVAKTVSPAAKASQHSMLFAKIEIFIECCDGLEVPTTTKVPVPIVVVLKNVLCRGLGLAALADRVDHDIQ